tara:strand:- start:318 stop:446 length:129 start_codon:yes stop_codon:yes gene_type:complete
VELEHTLLEFGKVVEAAVALVVLVETQHLVQERRHMVVLDFK